MCLYRHLIQRSRVKKESDLIGHPRSFKTMAVGRTALSGVNYFVMTLAISSTLLL